MSARSYLLVYVHAITTVFWVLEAEAGEFLIQWRLVMCFKDYGTRQNWKNVK